MITMKIEFGPGFHKKLGARYDEFLDETVVKIAHEAEGICVREAPVDTGRLRGSISKIHPAKGTSGLRCGAYYWFYQQYGTSKMPSNPFLTRTVNQIISNKIPTRNLTDIMVREGVLR